MQLCSECRGSKLRKESMYVFLYMGKAGKQPTNIFEENADEMYTIYDLQRMTIGDLIEKLQMFEKTTDKAGVLVKRIMTPLLDRLSTIGNLGLGHLNLHRQIDTLS